MCIYKITNQLNGKSYIGRTTRTIEARWREHLKRVRAGDMRHLYVAMRKYGIENFSIEKLVDVSTIAELSELEAYYCAYYDTYRNGYNMTAGGEANPMDFEKSRESHKAKMRSPELRNKISATMKSVRAASANDIYIHKGNIQKRISSNLLDEYLANKWEIGTVKGKIRLHNCDNVETTIFPEYLDEYLKAGWIIGGKPGRLTPEHKAKLAASHKVTEEFRQNQRECLLKYYKEHPDRITRSQHKITIENIDTGECISFKSCKHAADFMQLPSYIATSGLFSKWIKIGYIPRKSSKYYNWLVYYTNEGGDDNE